MLEVGRSMLVASTRLGELNVSPSALIEFAEGFSGLPEWRQGVLVPVAELPCFFWLQFVHDPAAAFLLLALEGVLADYDFALARQAAAFTPQSRVYAIIRVPAGDLSQATANLLAPVVIDDLPAPIGRQVILHDTVYPLRHPLFVEDEPC
ncbi:MAG: Flagellar assembly factor FliW [Firmicutes bacterium]|nr:Flagellar assembly factor FliW [Bacillota bacterium]